MKLTGKQKRYLRRIGQQVNASGAIGKSGLTEAAVAKIDTLLHDHELVKVRLSGPAADLRHETADQLADQTDAALVSTLGHTVLLYRPEPEIDPQKRINLPG